MDPLYYVKLLRKVTGEPNSSNVGDYSFEDTNDTQEPDDDSDDLMQEGPAMRSLREHTGAMPKREPVGIGRKIASALIAGATGFTSGAEKGIKLGQEIQDAPFNRKLSDWNMEQKKLGDLAALEEKDQSRKSIFQARKDANETNQLRTQLAQKDKEAERQRKIDEFTQEHERKIQQMIDNKESKDSILQATKNYHEGMLKLGQDNADTKKTLAQIAQQNANTNAEKAKKGIGGPGAAQRIAQSFDNHPVTKEFNVIKTYKDYADSMDNNTTNPADDQGLIYTFAKISDPQGSVKEGEYKTVQKYSQSLLKTLGNNALRMVGDHPILTPATRKYLKDNIKLKYDSVRKQHAQIANEYGRRINKITGGEDGIDYLTNYGDLGNDSKSAEDEANAYLGLSK